MENYGGTFNSEVGAPVSVGRVTVWHDVEEVMPGGAYLKPSEAVPVGTVIPAGTPVAVDVPGGEPTLNGASPVGLSKDDRVMGSEGCTLTVVTRGSIYAKRIEATVTAAQKAGLGGRILFINA